MKSFTAGHISSAEAAELMKAAQEALGGPQLQFYPGVSYRNLVVYRGAGRPAPFSPDTRTTPPHDLTDGSVLGRLSPRAGQRPAERPDEREHGAFSPIIR